MRSVLSQQRRLIMLKRMTAPLVGVLSGTAVYFGRSVNLEALMQYVPAIILSVAIVTLVFITFKLFPVNPSQNNSSDTY